MLYAMWRALTSFHLSFLTSHHLLTPPHVVHPPLLYPLLSCHIMIEVIGVSGTLYACHSFLPELPDDDHVRLTALLIGYSIDLLKL